MWLLCCLLFNYLKPRQYRCGPYELVRRTQVLTGHRLLIGCDSTPETALAQKA